MIENGMVMPTDVNFDCKRQRKVVFYGRVSTDSEDQLESYKAQVAYYTDAIAKNPRWRFVDIYADEEIIYGEQ